VFTQCSKCETVFKLSAEVLRAAGGQVRCGKCGDVFNALAHLAEDPSAFTSGESEFDLESRADSILESPAPMTLRRPPESADDFSEPGVEIARLQILDWNENESPDSPAAQIEQPAAVEIGETSMEFTLPPGELDRIFVETKKRALLPPLPPMAPDAPPQQPDSQGMDIFNDEDPETASLPARASAFEPTPRGINPLPWRIAAAAAALLLLVQFVHHNREWLIAHAPLGGSLRAVYLKMGAPVATPANLAAYQLRQWGVTGDPAGDGTLRLRASILNTAAQLEPFPLLRVTLANRFGSSLGTRDFEASEYLGKPTARLLAPGERVDATLDILDPGNSAEGFEIDVCLRSGDRKISCANDAAPAQAKR
jgi:predicted Zn finger-like uncharacterized protein